MTLILNGTDNSATTPAVTGTDTDTGVYYPAANQVALATNGTERMRIDSSGNVGIGTTSPATILHVANTGSSGVQSIRLENSEGYAQISTDSNLATYDAQLHLFNNRARSTEYMRISSTGGLSVGTTSDPGAGAIYATGNITAYFSDDRLKTKLGNIQDALSKVKALSGFYYEANQTAQDLGYKPVREAGVSAQQVQAVMPEVVKPAPIDAQYLTVDYERLVPLLIEAIKELDAKVEGLVKA